jgi:hypothetical protein
MVSYILSISFIIPLIFLALTAFLEIVDLYSELAFDLLSITLSMSSLMMYSAFLVGPVSLIVLGFEGMVYVESSM